MNLSALTAISPIDGRYRKTCEPLAQYFSEEALMQYRVRVEIEYFIALCELPLPQLASFNKSLYPQLRAIFTQFNSEEAQKIKEIEKTTNHDVKAVEYFIKDKMEALGIGESKEFVHFGLTSQDINNTSIPLSIKEGLEEIILPFFERIMSALHQMSLDWKNVSMLARTHGQPASPTKLGKEIKVFEERLRIQINQLKSIPFSAKFGGATGNFNAHHIAYPSINWVTFANDFLKNQLTLERSQTTTQIEHYDNLAALFDCLKRINTIFIDFARDMWTYISMEYFKQKIKAGEIGSSAMPHKVNPIDFENAEGNLGIANAIFEHLSAKLPISRMQRDLTDSTVLRNIGVPIAHTLIALQSIQRGVDKLLLNESAFERDLENNWAVVAEAIQTVLRREGYPQPYEALKALTRTNEGITANSIANFIDELSISNELKIELKKISPHNYTGVNLVD
jgi:adenylosuccinate lyase